MQSRPFSYLLSISYFGARYKGWAPQPNQPTVQRQLERVIRHVVGHEDFTLIGSSRTDSGVSCQGGYVQMFFREEPAIENFQEQINLFLPQDIRINSIEKISPNFNLIQSISEKTYRYYFSNDVQNHPFSTAFLQNIPGELNWEKMNEACRIIIGNHDFKAFCTPSSNKTDYRRTILSSKISSTDEFQGIFFPEKIFCFQITGTGFLHHQVRILMSVIWMIGNGEMELEELSGRLNNPEGWTKIPPAPSNGLVLWETKIKD